MTDNFFSRRVLCIFFYNGINGRSFRPVQLFLLFFSLSDYIIPFPLRCVNINILMMKSYRNYKVISISTLYFV